MRLVVHIGLHKTGTTSLQLMLAQNRELLRAHRVLYPEAAAVEAGGHLNLVWQATGSWKYQPDAGGIDELVAEARQHRPEVLLISAESLSGYAKNPAPLAIVEHISQALGSKPEIVCTIRPQHIMLDSLYAQNASTGYTTQRFEHYSIEVLNRGTLDFETLLGRWFDRFGHVTLIPVDCSTSLETRFLAATGLDHLPPLSSVGTANRRPSARVVEYCRVATEILNRMKVRPLRRRAILAGIRADVEAKYPTDRPFSGLTPEFVRLLREHFRPSNLRFRKQRLAGAKLFTASDPDNTFRTHIVDFNSISADERLYFLEIFSVALDQHR